MISVVIPTYNHAKYLPRAIASVRAQNFAPLEIIVVNDGSTDETASLVPALSAQGPLCWIDQKNAGRAAARNRGIQESKGDWVAFLDADDYWLPDKLRTQFQELQAADDFSYCGTLLQNDAGEVLASRPAVPSQNLVQDLLWQTGLCTSTAVIRRSLLDRIGPFDETLWMGEDWDLFIRLAIHGKGRCTTAPLVVMRPGIWDDKYTMLQYESSQLRVLRRLFDEIQERNDLRPIARERGRVFSWHYAILAKSFLRHHDRRRFLYYGLKSAVSHPKGLVYLLPKNLTHTIK